MRTLWLEDRISAKTCKERYKLVLDATIKTSQVFMILFYNILCGFCVKYILIKMINHTFSSTVDFTFNSVV